MYKCDVVALERSAIVRALCRFFVCFPKWDVCVFSSAEIKSIMNWFIIICGEIIYAKPYTMHAQNFPKSLGMFSFEIIYQIKKQFDCNLTYRLRCSTHRMESQPIATFFMHSLVRSFIHPFGQWMWASVWLMIALSNSFHILKLNLIE